MKIAPSLLSADFGNLAQDIRRLEAAGADWLHFDVMDGHFVPNLSMGPGILRAVRSLTDLPIDVHLMIDNPDDFLGAFREAGADRILVHHEVCTHLHRTLGQIRHLGAAAGVVFNPATPLALEPATLELLDQILLMTVNPGFPAQAFIPGVLPKVAQAAALVAAHGGAIEIEVDGGIDPESGRRCREAGATVMVAGNYVLNHPGGPTEAIQSLR